MKYKIYRRKEVDGRAPSEVHIKDYEFVGDIESESRSELPRAVFNSNDFSKHEVVKIGDIIVGSDKKTFIYTPNFTWAEVVLNTSKL